MKTALFIKQFQTLGFYNLSKRRIQISTAYVLIVMLMSFSTFKAQTSKVIPDSNVSGSFLGPLANAVLYRYLNLQLMLIINIIFFINVLRNKSL